MKKILVLALLMLAVSLFSYDTFYDLISDYSEGAEIDNFVGYVEMDESKLADLVPDTFPNSEGDKTWLEYAKLTYPSDFGIKLTVGWRDENGNLTHVITSEEFYLWTEYWGIENFVLNNDKGIKTIAQMPIKGAKRYPVGISPNVDTSRLVAFTVNNAYLTQLYGEEGIEENETIKALTGLALMTGGGCFTSDLKAHTTYLINIDNITPYVFGMLVSLNGSIWIDWFDQHDLFMEVDLPSDLATYTKSDKGLVPLKGKDWEYIRHVTNPLVWDKYTKAWLE